MKAKRTLAQLLTEWVNIYARKEGHSLTKMALGMEILLINASKLAAVYLLAVLVGVFWQTLIVHGVFVALRRYSFGIHALNSSICTAISCIMFVIVPWLLVDRGINGFGAVIAFGCIIVALYKYAPADTKARPLIGIELRARLRLKAVICGIVLLIIAFLIPSESFRLLMILGAVYQIVAIHPLTYKLLKRSDKNYEKFECE